MNILKTVKDIDLIKGKKSCVIMTLIKRHLENVDFFGFSDILKK